MISKNRIKFLKSLSVKKFRQKEQKFLVEGRKIIQDGIESNFFCEELFYVPNSDFEQIITTASKKSVKLTEITEIEAKQISETENTQGIFALFHFSKTNILWGTNFVIALENISDPGNLGTILRTADWFGVKEILISSDSVDVFNPKVIRSAMGSIFHLKIKISDDFYNEIEILKKMGFLIYLADLKGEDYSLPKFKHGKRAVIFCNEANGASNKIKEISQQKITIPKKGSAESLNVAVSSGIILSELIDL